MVIDRDDGDEEDGEDQGNLSEQSVTDLSNAIKRTVEDRFGLVRVRGEIGRVSRPRSGHVYLSLKDEKSVLDGVLWKGVAARLAVTPEEGMEVVATGRLTTFGGQSKYQIVIDHLVPAGAGALMAMLDARRRALEAEGLFAAERKRAIPLIPRTIGVVTSPSGAVIRDILHRLAERFPCDVLVWPVAVQGQKSAEEVAAAIRGFDALEEGGAVPRPDVLIVARGGGSLEDLWSFNEEAVVRAAAACRIPLISAIGHETDVTLLDHVADLRAPTPTGAAEKAVPVRTELLALLSERGGRRLRAMERFLSRLRERAGQAGRLLPRPDTLIGDRRQRLDFAGQTLSRGLADRLGGHRATLATARARLRPAAMQARLRDAGRGFSALSARLSARRLIRDLAERRDRADALRLALDRAGKAATTARATRLAALTRTIEALSYQRILDRGYAVVRDGEDRIVTAPDTMRTGDPLTLEFARSKRLAAVVGKAGRKQPKGVSKAATKRQEREEDAPPDLFDLI